MTVTQNPSSRGGISTQNPHRSRVDDGTAGFAKSSLTPQQRLGWLNRRIDALLT
jgi:hypothetical protein